MAVGGKILARYEAPVHKLLFPEAAVDSGDLREVKLNKSRKYQVWREMCRRCISEVAV